MRFLAQPNGKDFYLNVMRGWVRKRYQRPDGDRYLDDVLLDRWIGEFAATLSRPWADGMPFEITPAIEAADDAHYKRVAKRVTYLDTPSLPIVSDSDFAEFTRRYPEEHEPNAVRQRFLEFCETLNAR